MTHHIARALFSIGHIDCYVAVTGLPKPQSNHAVLMAMFGKDCRNKLQEVTRELASELGSDTENLTIRVGLHSGPTTAGVLRGDKGRFQLFGDTVNTAARMESNGSPNRIHVSESTAQLIKAAGKGSWITKRQDLVFAKGKGEMQTYWCEPKSSGSVYSYTSSFAGRSSHDGSTASLDFGRRTSQDGSIASLDSGKGSAPLTGSLHSHRQVPTARVCFDGSIASMASEAPVSATSLPASTSAPHAGQETASAPVDQNPSTAPAADSKGMEDSTRSVADTYVAEDHSSNLSGTEGSGAEEH